MHFKKILFAALFCSNSYAQDLNDVDLSSGSVSSIVANINLTDLSGATVDASGTLHGVVNQVEGDDISRMLRFNQNGSAWTGISLGSFPFGYDVEGITHVENNLFAVVWERLIGTNIDSGVTFVAVNDNTMSIVGSPIQLGVDDVGLGNSKNRGLEGIAFAADESSANVKVFYTVKEEASATEGRPSLYRFTVSGINASLPSQSNPALIQISAPVVLGGAPALGDAAGITLVPDGGVLWILSEADELVRAFHRDGTIAAFADLDLPAGGQPVGFSQPEGIVLFNNELTIVGEGDEIARYQIAGATDSDGDGIADNNDNCPLQFNPAQTNSDNDTAGDACDSDDDNDGVADIQDAFPLNPDESIDTDNDGTGNNADIDDDDDGVADALDAFPLNPDETSDSDVDGVGDNTDNCPDVANSNQADTDSDNIGDACDTPEPPDANLTVQLQNIQTDLCMTVDNSSTQPGEVVRARECVDGAANQQITLESVAGKTDFYTLMFVHSAMCLDIFPSRRDDLWANGNDAVQTTCNGSDSQQFRLFDESADVHLLYTNTGRTNKVLRANRFVRQSTESPYGRWRFFVGSDAGIQDSDGDGIANDVDNCPTVANSNQADTDGDNIGDACDTPEPPDVNLTVQLQNIQSDLCMTVDNNSIQPGEVVRARECMDGAANQRITLEPVAGKTDFYTLTFVHSAMCLDIFPSRSDDLWANGNDAVQNSCDGSDSQQFRLFEESADVHLLYTNTGRTDRVLKASRFVRQSRESTLDNRRWRFSGE